MGVDPSGLFALAFTRVLTSIGPMIDLLVTTAVSFASRYGPYGVAVALAATRINSAVGMLGGYENVRNNMIEWMNSGDSVLSVIAADMIAHSKIISEYLRAAIEAVQATGRHASSALRRLPFFIVSKSRTPEIFSFNESYLSRNRHMHVLNYNGPASPITFANRMWVRSTYSRLMPMAPPGYQLDKYPYASTAQGGMAGPAEGKPVPARENSVQGGDLSAFYRSRLKSVPGVVFIVVPVPI